MRQGKTANVFIPLFENIYRLSLYGTIDLPLEEKCRVITPSGDDFLMTTADTMLNRLEYRITASEAASGLYSVNCSIAFHDAVEGFNHTLVASKSLNIAFIRGRCSGVM